MIGVRHLDRKAHFGFAIGLAVLVEEVTPERHEIAIVLVEPNAGVGLFLGVDVEKIAIGEKGVEALKAGRHAFDFDNDLPNANN